MFAISSPVEFLSSMHQPLVQIILRHFGLTKFDGDIEEQVVKVT